MNSNFDFQRRGWKIRAGERCRAILDGAAIGVTLGSEDERFLLDLLSLHPEAEQKAGPGVAAFTVEPSPAGMRGRCFRLHRVDGTSEVFSFRKCITAPPHRANVTHALRRAILPDVMAFKQATFDVVQVCAVSGAPLVWDDTHVDHYDPTFKVIADSWVESQGGYNAIHVRAADDWGAELSPELAEDFRRYHNRTACLRLVTAEVNLQLAKLAAQAAR